MYRLVAVLLAPLLTASALADEKGGAPAPVSEEQAVAFLKAFVKDYRAGRAEHAWQTYDGAAFAGRAFAKEWPQLDAARRAQVVDLTRRGVPAMDARSGLPWGAARASVSDFRGVRLKDGSMAASFAWRLQSMEKPVRWGAVIERRPQGLRIVDFVFDPTLEEPLLGSAVLAQECRKQTAGGSDLITSLRSYFGLFLPGTMTPEGASVDWASPDVLALDIAEPVVAGAPVDGWHAIRRRADGTDWYEYRRVVHILRDGRACMRMDFDRRGSARPLELQPLLGDGSAATLRAVRTLYGVPLIRADRRTPWAAIRALLARIPERRRARTAFSVRRAKGDGPPRWGQVGLRADGVVPVASSRAALRARGGFERSVPDARTQTRELAIRLTSRVGDRERRETWIKVGDQAERRLGDEAEAAARSSALASTVKAVNTLLAARRQRRVVIEVPKGAGDAVPHGDVIQVLATLRALPAMDVDIAVAEEPKVVWTLPEGWVEAQGKQAFRLATLVPAGTSSTDCAVMSLAGTAGGWKLNFKRWYNQMGASPSDTEIEQAVSRLRVAGVDAYFVSIAGSFRGMGASVVEADALMYALVCQLPSQTLFVKMVGPRSEMEPELGRFKAFCTSLRVP